MPPKRWPLVGLPGSSGLGIGGSDSADRCSLAVVGPLNDRFRERQRVLRQRGQRRTSKSSTVRSPANLVSSIATTVACAFLRACAAARRAGNGDDTATVRG